MTKILKGGTLYYDTPVGVLCLESMFPKPPGHLRNPTTFKFPVVCSVVRGVDIPKLLFDPTPDLLEPFIEAARQLERDGVKAITGSCGFLARFQPQIADAVNVPVFMSSLVQIPLVRLFHGENAGIGVLTASAKALTQEHFQQTGSDMDQVVVKGMEGFPEFWETIIEGKRNDFDMERLENEICQAAAELVEGHGLDALVLECTDLSAFSHAIQERVKVPVYDIDSLVEYARYAVQRRPYPHI
ncbi:MAG: aspartate/glutamate racemase family protein [Desulfobacterales bacterium]|nr:aspartate/glutamate racemase family protein [Desulfobacterales bacterium]